MAATALERSDKAASAELKIAEREKGTVRAPNHILV
jgi:hypothetical protein